MRYRKKNAPKAFKIPRRRKWAHRQSKMVELVHSPAKKSEQHFVVDKKLQNNWRSEAEKMSITNLGFFFEREKGRDDERRP